MIFHYKQPNRPKIGRKKVNVYLLVLLLDLLMSFLIIKFFAEQSEDLRFLIWMSAFMTFFSILIVVFFTVIDYKNQAEIDKYIELQDVQADIVKRLDL